MYHPFVPVGVEFALHLKEGNKINRFGWCCWRELNSRPLPYQGSALPLSYSSAVRGRLDSLFEARKRGLAKKRSAVFRRLDPLSRLRYIRPMDRGNRKTRASKDSDREDRLKAALKANLARRKAQARARSENEPGDAGQTTDNDSD